MKRRLVLLVFFVLAAFTVSGCSPAEEELAAKPVIYLYPEVETAVTVTLDYDGQLTTTYPAYDGSWHVTALPDGTLYDAEGREYSYLFWEGVSDTAYDFSQGFCIPGADTAEFLRSSLEKLGLTPREYNEFIVYWLPRMEGNAYNLIAFQSGDYTDHARLTISPEPQSVLRVFMAWQALEEPVEIEPQDLPSLPRTGFTVVEWGGIQVR